MRRPRRRLPWIILVLLLLGASNPSTLRAETDMPGTKSTVSQSSTDAPIESGAAANSGAEPSWFTPVSPDEGKASSSRTAPLSAPSIETDSVDGASAETELVRPTLHRSEDGWGFAIPMVRFVGSDHNVVRRGPGEGFAIVDVVEKGVECRVIAKSGDWFNVELSETTTGWVHSALCEEFEDLSHLEMRPNPRLFSRVGAFTLSGYAGGYAYDRKSNSVALGGRMGYYLFDFLEVEGGVSWTHIERPAEIVESLFDLRLEAEDFHMLYYNLGLRLELLPGRRMVPYALAGVGASILQGRTESAFHYGGGTMLFVNKTTAVRWELRSYQFESGFDRARRRNHNVEFSLGTSVLF